MLFCRVLAVTGCVLLAGASVAEESYVHGYVKEEGVYVPPHARTSPPSSEVDRWSARRRAYPEPVKERTKDVMRAKRPK
jgi:hypothetical protein